MYRVVLAPEARADLIELRDLIAERSSGRMATRYMQRIGRFYAGLAVAPHRGEERFSHRPGLRSIGFERRVTILFAVSGEDRVVTILGFYYAGRIV